MTQGAFPGRARIVVIGGGIVGCSIAYHLPMRGESDVIVLEQNKLTAGTTWHAAGLVSQLKSTHSLTKLATYSTELIASLESNTGVPTGYRRTGSISVASDPERWQEILRGMSMAKTVGVEMHEISVAEARELWPLMNTDDLVGAAFIPGDGHTNPVDTTMALATGARSAGVRIIEDVAVDSIRVVDGHVAGVDTEAGFIEAEVVVVAAGIWSRQLAATAGVRLPIQACEHFYVVTEPVEGISPGTPVLRDPANFTYYREDAGKLMAGFFEPRGKVWSPEGVPRDFRFGTLPGDWNHVGPIFERSVHRVPALSEVGIRLLFNGPEAFTPDGVYYVGETAEVDGCFVAAGFNSVGIQSGPGVGRVLADWIVDGRAPMDLWPVDVRRALPFQAETRYLSERIPESLGLLYAMHWPHRQYESARGILRSPVHDRLDEAGAVFGTMSGWERPNWFADAGQARSYRYSYGKQNWFANTGAECRAVRQAVGLFDQTSFVRAEVAGPDAAAALDWLSANEISGPVGKVTYTQWLNDVGGIEADLTVARLDQDRFLVVSGSGAPARDMAHLRRGLRGMDATVTDVTGDLAMFGLMGPRSRDVLESLSGDAFDDAAFPFGSTKTVSIAGVEMRATRLTYVGEMGWELYPSFDAAPSVFDALVEAGGNIGLRLAGFHAMDSLRMEAGYRHWGHDVGTDDNPLEAGLGFAVAWDKPGGFRGREALAGERARPRARRLVHLRLEDPELLVYHDEPILREGSLVGRTTSGAWSYVEDRCLAMGYVTSEAAVDSKWLATGAFEIEIAGEPMPATASLRPFFDPGRLRVGGIYD